MHSPVLRALRTFVKSLTHLEGNMSEQKRKLIRFGSKVKTAFETARHFVSAGANPLWMAPDKLPSGSNVLACFSLYRASELVNATIRQKY